MENFVHRQNIQHFEKLLAKTTGENDRRRLQALIAEEEARFEAAVREHALKAAE